MKNFLFSLALLAFLAGCDAANEAATKVIQESGPMTLVFHPGYKMLVAGKPSPIFGTDECPKADPFMKAFFGPEPDEGDKSCVVVAPETKSVEVLISSTGRPVKETWTVERKNDLTMLRRADGSYVLDAKEPPAVW
ncbi:hypothetical protein [Pseudomonas aeruginosa]|uniref:hypothetical protein n=1 Tax=Pseudomonas aeruginosa TaxID=287 RepID=UPI003D2AF7CF